MLPKGLLKEYSRTLSFIIRGIDVCAMVVSGLIAYYFKFQDVSLPPSYVNALLVSAILVLIVFPFSHVYDSMRGQGIWFTIKKLSQALLTVLILLAGLAFFTKTGNDYSREWFFYWAVFAFALLTFFRCTMLICLRLMRSYGLNERKVIIIGAGDLGERLMTTIQHAHWTGFRVTTIFDDNLENQNKTIEGVLVEKTPADLDAYLKKEKGKLDEVWIALPLLAEVRVKELLHELRHHTIAIRYILDIFGLGLLNHSITSLAGFPAVTLNSSPMVGVSRCIKAMEDRVLSAIILLMISPLLVMLAIAVKLSSSGPIFYRQRRVSWNGKEFDMLKFRTMPVNAESATGPVWATKGEARATKVGQLLRRTSLDELPQFINVLKGEMSIVGPRPERPVFVEQFKDQIPRYMQKHLVKAGITGWAQINGWRGNTSLEKRIEYDLYYIENWSFWFDLKIIFFTFFRGLVNKNAY